MSLLDLVRCISTAPFSLPAAARVAWILRRDFSGDRFARVEMRTDDRRIESRLTRQLDRLRELARRPLYRMAARRELFGERAEERHVRRVGEIDPDSHRR